MSPQRFAKVAVMCGTVVLAAWCGGRLGVGPVLVQTTAAVPVEVRPAALLPAEPERADTARPMGNLAAVNADVAPVAEAETAVASEIQAAKDESKLIVEAALPDSPPLPAPEPPLVQVASADPFDPMPIDPMPIEVKKAVALIEIPDECLDSCIDRYLWALYQRTAKEDSLKVHERRKVAIKRKGKMVTVTRTFTRLVDQDFTWKDPKAAERAGMPMMDYVIGGMDRGFRTKLFHTLRAAELAGMSPGITSAFRDDYRQSIASGMKAATDRSYHGGSFRGGYGHGLAADVVSVDGATRNQRWASTEKFWKWIDAHGKEFGIGRPYLGRDPPHVAPIDGREYAAHNPGMRAHAAVDLKKRTRLATRDSATKKPGKRKVVQNARPIRQGAISDRPRMAMAEPGRG
ncbi:MAG: hypothetical protein QOJ84_5583 [Bradyrhizobium sp.]|jgi:hypothetical protein|nr:hypothetical protein [Bradyrhizobium sp.]